MGVGLVYYVGWMDRYQSNDLDWFVLDRSVSIVRFVDARDTVGGGRLRVQSGTVKYTKRYRLHLN